MPLSTVISLTDVLVSECYTYASLVVQIAVERRYWYAFASTGPGPITFGDLAAQLDLDLGPLLNAVSYNSADYLGTRVRRMRPVGTDSWATNNASGGNGTAGAVALPTQCAPLISFRSDTLGKAGEGRMYTPFPSASDVVGNGVCSAGLITRLSALGSYFVTPLVVTAGGSSMTFFCSPFKVGQTGPLSPYTQAIVAGVFATQKRRGAYGRTNLPPFT
jgi:hypothetical protein